MKLLVIGGTRFVGRHLVEAALKEGMEVTLFHRGASGCDLFPEAEHLHGDRDGGLEPLRGRHWDAAVDTCGYVPRIVRASAELLADQVNHYTFISTISVYSPFTAGMDETAPVATLEDPATETITAETYGGLKVLCEQAAEEAMPGRVLHVRPGIIVGPYDPTDRFTYWVRRIPMGGPVLVPGPPERPIQFIHAGDLGAWVVRMLAAGRTGVYNATGPEPPHTMEAVVRTCKEVGGGNADFVWVDEPFLKQNEVGFWRELPLCIEWESHEVFLSTIRKSVEAGLELRPLVQTIRETLAWDVGRPPGTQLAAGLKADREADLLKRWTGGAPAG